VDQSLIELKVPLGTTLIEAVRLSGIAQQYPELDLRNSVKGIFSKIVDDDWVLQEHDRVEIYRSLKVDPKEARRRRAMKDIEAKI
jgi:putative ubiquitin-RnfH superfamily antitoxin RatB of RatAB toxin-antitoxin module